MRIDILTLFPALIDSVMGESVIGRAQARGLIEVTGHRTSIIKRMMRHMAGDAVWSCCRNRFTFVIRRFAGAGTSIR